MRKSEISGRAINALVAWNGLLIVLMSLVLVSVGQAQLDQTKIAFTSDRDGNSEIYVMNPDGTDLVNLRTILQAILHLRGHRTGRRLPSRQTAMVTLKSMS